ncbi:ferrous iron transporter B [Candidatus Contubernalis alkaliaceticus]|uniref:ferrous iron transporter B n=1 Tax=Candidatus Contubernalis alkaliaceticus TaxID=338645 RepID=UPI001F4C4E29|nr:ferrous iron transporter B [Candidatus Contubernalis alkalaceticus]UNC93012.1 ferrous iron transporter B [Candidatus Contubernalis alkalaceticus]
MHCSKEKTQKDLGSLLNILLIGPPNVGKSVFFNRLTGLDVNVANYVGTTVEYTRGKTQLNSISALLVDVPGTYTLDATNEAEQVAVEMLNSNPSGVMVVVDANNLESSLYLLLQLLEQKLPTIVALNRYDLARDKGFEIDVSFLSIKLGVPVVPTIAVVGEGIQHLKQEIEKVISRGPTHEISWKEDKVSRWQKAEELSHRALKPLPQKPPLLQRQKWGEWLVKPWPGLPMAVLFLFLILAAVIGIGMGLRRFVLLPLFQSLIIPQIVFVVEAVIPTGIFQNIFIGEYGFLVKGLEWPFALVLPYVISFYSVLGILEDSGYLPRLGALLDGLLNKIGLQGSSVVPLLLGLGCGIPGILATRNLNSQKERVVVSSLICLAVPCISQTGAFVSLLAERSIAVVLAVFGVSAIAMASAGLILDRVVKGPRFHTLMEIPELLIPRKEILFKKVWIRLKRFITDGAVPMIVAVGLAAVMYETGLMTVVGQALSPLVTGWLRLPEEAAVPLILGILRREMAVLPLMEMNLDTLQLFTGAVVGLFYVPCIAMIAVLAREFKLTLAFGILIMTTGSAFLIGGLLARLGALIL